MAEPKVLITAQTTAAESEEFIARPYDLPMGLSGWGFQSGDEVVIHRHNGDDFVALTDTDATMDSTNPNTSITSTGIYKLVKGTTTGAVGASKD